MIGWPGVTLAAPASQWAGRYILLAFSLCLQDVTSLTSVKVISAKDGVVEGSMAVPSLPVRRVEGVAGAPTQLPCLVTHAHNGDAPLLVLWYKDGARFPFYTLDLREGGEQQEYVDPGVKGRVRSVATGAHLTFDPLQGRDTGRYRCRVDFEVSPTLFALVDLTVYVVPSRLVVVDQMDRPVPAGLLGPLTEGEPLTLYCVATGGWPVPEVTWWRGSTLLANHSLILGHNGPISTSSSSSSSSSHASSPSHASSHAPSMVGAGVRQVRTEVSVPALSRDYVHANLTCRATNNNITEPLSTTLALLLYLRPKSVSIRSPQSPLVEGQEARLECVAEGAYPAATLSWTLTSPNHDVTTALASTSRHLGDRTSSFVKVKPAAEDHLATLTCTAFNPNITAPGITTTTVIRVVFAPRVRLELGANLGNEPITEGKDVYFECEVDANPPTWDVIWRRNGQQVTNQRKSGVLVSGMNLVLQMVRRSSAGNYTCTAANALGSTISNPVNLDVRYLPVCLEGPQTVAVAEGESTRLTCRVDAQPCDHLTYTWIFNNTLDTIRVDRHRIILERGLSILDYTPRSPRDYGTLSCWATNAVGTQADPCRFTVIEAGPPERVDKCVLVNLTSGSLEVGCTPGNDGGLKQRFVARVYAAPTHALLATLEEDTPRFHVGGLTPGQDYLITVTAVNAKGASLPQQIDAVRLKVAEKRMVEVGGSSPPVSPLVGVFLGLVGGFVLLLLAGVLLTRARSNRCWGHRGGEGGMVTSSNSPQPTITTTSTTTSAHHHHHHHHHPYDTEDRPTAPDVLRTINAELLETQLCPEIIPARVPPPPYSRVQTGPRESLQVGPLVGVAGRPLYRESPSPLHLLHDQSFV
ncbi:nephrin-like [Homarus americanus]|uniref:nephrin-like n=2 Tax=Homarus americanus TaxID=6706 RepID=UPI001C476240|nr:nephrin-like [Homarus americanus]